MTGTVAQVLQELLRDQGVQHVFGIIGRESAAITFDEVPGIDFVLTRHEFTAAVMAGVLASLSGRPQVCFSTLGPGMTNLCAGVGTAMLDRLPLIAVSAQAETHDSFPGASHQCLDNVAVMAPITKYSAELRAPEQLSTVVGTAFARSAAEPPGPSFISLPVDRLRAEGPVTEAVACLPPATADTSVLLEEQYGQLAQLVAEAAHPALVIGAAAVRSPGLAQAVRSWAERLRIPVITTYGAKGVLPHDHPLNYGAFSAYLDSLLDFPATEQLFGPVDLVLALGYDYAEDLRPAEWTTGMAKTVVRVASVPNPVPHVFQPDLDVAGDVAATVRELDKRTADIPAKTPHDIEPLRDRVAAFLADASDHSGVLPVQQIVDVLNTQLQGETLVSDIGFFRHYVGLFARIDRPQGFITSAGCSSFGFGLPAAMAVALARPREPVFLIAGDGGFHSSSVDLETAARLGLNLVIVVVNNNRNGLIELYQNIGHDRCHAPTVEFGAVDFAKLAQANGCHGLRATDPVSLARALEQARQLGGPVVIDVPSAYEFRADNFLALAKARQSDPA